MVRINYGLPEKAKAAEGDPLRPLSRQHAADGLNPFIPQQRFDIARKTPRITHEGQRGIGADHDQVGSQLFADLADPRQICDLVRREDIVHFRNSRRSSSAASRARGSLPFHNSA